MIVDKDGIFPNSFGLSAKASFVTRVKSMQDLAEAIKLAKDKGLPLLSIGEGTNIIPKPYTETVLAILENSGLEKNGNLLKISAGERWDDAVAFAVKENLSGIEALSGIPGTAGAGPVQNIGAYGSEICNTLEYLEAYDKHREEFVTISNKECCFGYRDSIFKQHKGRWIILKVILKLQLLNDRNEVVKMPEYKDVKNYFSERKNVSPNLRKIREAIIEIRKNKLPDPKVVPNCGSFFKNPIVNKNLAEKIKSQFTEAPMFPAGERIKIPAGYLIEKCGFKGQKVGRIEVYKNNALVLTNPHNASFQDLLFAKSEIENAVFQKFGVKLEPEVNIL